MLAGPAVAQLAPLYPPITSFHDDPTEAPSFDLASQPTVLPQQDVGTKSPPLAAFLSGYFPGFALGSFYAGHTSHGLRHLAVTGGSFALFAVGLGMGFGGSEAGKVPFYVGVIAFLGNWAWSTVTAVQDVNDHNARITAARSSASAPDRASVRPELHLSRLDWGSGFGVPVLRADVRLLHVRF